jgi:hypothetical protein
MSDKGNKIIKEITKQPQFAYGELLDAGYEARDKEFREKFEERREKRFFSKKETPDDLALKMVNDFEKRMAQTLKFEFETFRKNLKNDFIHKLKQEIEKDD